MISSKAPSEEKSELNRVKEQIIDDNTREHYLEILQDIIREEYLRILETEIAKAFITAYEEQAQSLFAVAGFGMKKLKNLREICTFGIDCLLIFNFVACQGSDFP